MAYIRSKIARIATADSEAQEAFMLCGLFVGKSRAMIPGIETPFLFNCVNIARKISDK